MIKVPQGTIVVSEKPSDANGQVLENAEPGWFALKDDPALSGTEITSPKQETDESGAAQRHLQIHRQRPPGTSRK